MKSRNTSQSKTCWHCGKALQMVKGKLVYAEVSDPLGYITRVHKCCLPDVVNKYYKEVR